MRYICSKNKCFKKDNVSRCSKLFPRPPSKTEASETRRLPQGCAKKSLDPKIQNLTLFQSSRAQHWNRARAAARCQRRGGRGLERGSCGGITLLKHSLSLSKCLGEGLFLDFHPPTFQDHFYFP